MVRPALSVTEVRDRLAELSAAAWTYTAIGVAVELGLPSHLREPIDAASLAAAGGIPVALATSLAEALVAGGLARRTGDACFVVAPSLGDMAVNPPAELLRADMRTGLLQMAALFDAATRGSVQTGWAHTDERILQAQGTTSAGAIDLLEKDILPLLSGMLDRLGSGEGAFLDVGAGVAAVSIALCRQHPKLRAVALEPHDPARRLAERNVADAGLAERIETRAGRIEALEALEEFDLVWLAGNFLGSDILPSALAVVHRALRPGGYVLNASLGGGGDDQRSVAARLRAVLWGGDTVDPERVADRLSDAGFCDVVLMPRLPNGLVPMYCTHEDPKTASETRGADPSARRCFPTVSQLGVALNLAVAQRIRANNDGSGSQHVSPLPATHAALRRPQRTTHERARAASGRTRPGSDQQRAPERDLDTVCSPTQMTEPPESGVNRV